MLLQKVYSHVDLLEVKYFGLQFTDNYNVNVSICHYLTIIDYLSPKVLGPQTTCGENISKHDQSFSASEVTTALYKSIIIIIIRRYDLNILNIR